MRALLPTAYRFGPFVTNVTGDPESAWLSAGIAETESGDLRALRRFRVVDRWRVTEAARRTGGSLHDVAPADRTVFTPVFTFLAGRAR